VKTLLDIDFPKSHHIGVKNLDVEVVNEEAYLYHWFAVKYIKYITMSHYIKQFHDLRNDIGYERNDVHAKVFFFNIFWAWEENHKKHPQIFQILLQLN